jgi:RNA polymerase subunit RPABC4/transcription elongation factor Spt4
MVEYCPKCNAQLPPGLEKCPVCGQRIHSKNKDEYTWRDVFWITFTTLGVVLVPLLIIIGIVWLIIAILK